MDDLRGSPPSPAARGRSCHERKKLMSGVPASLLAACRYLVVIEGVDQRDEPPGLRFLVQRQQRNVSNKDGVKQPGHLQVVTGP